MFSFYYLKRMNECVIYCCIHKFKMLQSNYDNYERKLHEKSRLVLSIFIILCSF